MKDRGGRVSDEQVETNQIEVPEHSVGVVGDYLGGGFEGFSWSTEFNHGGGFRKLKEFHYYSHFTGWQ